MGVRAGQRNLATDERAGDICRVSAPANSEPPHQPQFLAGFFDGQRLRLLDSLALCLPLAHDILCPLLSEATRASHGPDEIDEYAFVVVLQVGQLVGEVGEVVAHASLQVLANVTIARGQRAAAALTYIREVKRSNL